MSNLKLVISSLAVTFLAGFLFVGVAGAHSFKSGDSVNVSGDKPLNQSLFLAGSNLDVSQEVEGDVFCVGQTVKISGKVHGDVICAAQTIRISGEIDGDIRLAAQTVDVSSKIGGNASVMSQTFTLDSAGSIDGDASVASQDSVFNGKVGRDIAIGGTNVTVDNSVGRDIRGEVSSLSFEDSAKVAGNVEYTSAKEAKVSQSAVIAGELTRSEPSSNEGSESKRGAFLAFGLGWFVYVLLSFLVITMALVLMWPKWFQQVSDKAIPRPWVALFIGFVSVIVAPVAFVLLMISFVGIPLGLLFMFIAMAVLILSGPVSAYYVGRLIMQKRRNHSAIYGLVGVGVVTIAYFIPIIGFLAFLLVLWTGVGMIVLHVFHCFKKPNYNLASAPAKKPKKATAKA